MCFHVVPEICDLLLHKGDILHLGYYFKKRQENDLLLYNEDISDETISGTKILVLLID